MVSRSRLKSLLTGLALYTMAALMVGYFGVNAYTGKYGLNARQELDQEIIALTSELARLKRERAEGEQRTLRARKDTKRTDPSEQVKVKKADRVRIVSMKPESVPRDAPSDAAKPVGDRR